jgi:exonuclease SbcC
MIVHHIKASGFRIIGQPMDIQFPDEGRIGILGQNESGKTTLLQVVEYALYGLKKGSGVEGDRENLVTWGKNEAKLEIEFTSGQNRYNLQRVFNVKSAHKAVLAPVINGIRDRSSSITGLKDVEDRIEQITGMDRDSFSKLVYIKQKDLDALRDLAKSKREQLVNKVMGIDLFDDASAKVKEDSSGLKLELEKKELQLRTVLQNKEDYESKLKQKGELEIEAADQQRKLEDQKKKLDEVKTILAKYEWLSSYNSENELVCAMKSQAAQVEENLQRIYKLEDNVEKLNATLSKCEPEVLELQSLREKLLDLERRLNDAQGSAKAIQEKKQKSIEKLGLSSKDLKLVSQDLPKQKHQWLVQFGAALACGLAFLVLAFFTTFVLVGAGLVSILLAIYVFSRYLKIDKLMVQNVEIGTLTQQLQEQESAASRIMKEKEDVTSKSPYKTSQEANARLITISEQMKQETGESSIEGIGALLRNADESLRSLRSSNPKEKKRELEDQIQAEETEIERLKALKPVDADELQYDKQQHETVKKNCEALQTEYGELQQASGKTIGNIQQLEKDLKRLKPDYEAYPGLEKEVQACRENVELLNRVYAELGETSKELRNKVIPHARFIINEILPTLTGDRYSDFEITEDLKFKVYSKESGGFKEREIFSGGTQDQFLIALRLAFTQSILDSRVMADKYSLLMDECTSSSDETRKQGIFEVLDAMKQTFSQIFIIAHEDIAAFVDQNIVLARNERGYAEVKSKSW